MKIRRAVAAVIVAALLLACGLLVERLGLTIRATVAEARCAAQCAVTVEVANWTAHPVLIDLRHTAIVMADGDVYLGEGDRNALMAGEARRFTLTYPDGETPERAIVWVAGAAAPVVAAVETRRDAQ